MKPEFREITSNDIDACVDIVKLIYPKDSEEKYHQALFKDISDVLNKAYPSKCLVALIEGKIVGFGCYVKIDPQTTTPNIFYKLTWININPKEQGRGIGKKLVNELEGCIRQECKEDFSIILETDKPDFYRKSGYDIYTKNGDNDCMQKVFPKITYPKILIGTLFSEVKDYCLKEWFDNVKKFTYPNFDLCMVDNSKDKKYHKKTQKYFSDRKKNSNIGKFTVLHTPRTHKKSEIFMAFSANELRNYFLKNDYDFLLNLECDIFPPADIIERLLCFNKPVIGATYFSGRKDTSYPMIVELLITNNEDEFTFDNPSYIKGFYEMTDTFEPKPYFGQGIGVCLWHRSVIEKIPFRADENTFYDSVFYADLHSNNIQNYLVPIMCRHENQIWDIQKKMIGQR